jgi:hypothetical protein
MHVNHKEKKNEHPESRLAFADITRGAVGLG